MAAERLRVLKMLEAGQITAEEAAKLLDALQGGPPPGRAAAGSRSVRIRLTDAASGRGQASVSLPLPLAQALLRAGAKLGGVLAPPGSAAELTALADAVAAGEPGRVVEWTEAETGRRVEVTIE